MSSLPSRPRLPWATWILIVVATALAWLGSGAGDNSIEAAGAWERARPLLTALSSPDLSTDALAQGFELTIQTIAVATWGTALGAAAGFVLALGASHRVAHVPGRAPSRWRHARVELVRLLLDGLRAIPDFAWALVVLVFIGAGPVTGALAIAISVTGLLGKIYSQLLDSTPPQRTQTVELTGSSRVVVALWGYVPAAAGPMLSYTLLRLECSMRNASVIGIVGGGGLGAALFEELGFGRYDRVATLLLFLLGLTAISDIVSKQIAKASPTRPRPQRFRLPLLAAFGLLVTALPLASATQSAWQELLRLDTAFLRATIDNASSLRLDQPTLTALFRDAAVPLSIAYLATGLAALAALLGLFLVPRHTTARGPLPRARQRGARLLVDAVALLARAIPDVVWLLLFGVALHVGPLAALAAISVHSFGLLCRLFVEAVHTLPPSRLEPRRLGTTRANFLWGVAPEIAPTLRTHVSLQAESNLRAGLIVGIVGAGGLGDAFHSSVTYWRLGDATLQALAMIGLTIAVDRLARRWSDARACARHR